jgi:hypothetical protein
MTYSDSRIATTRRSILGKAAFGITAATTGMLGATAILAQQPRVIRMGYVMGAGGSSDKAANEFAKIVADRSKGALAVQNFPGGQLGSERDMVESVQLGSIQVGFFGSYLAGNIVPEWGQVLDIPYLIRSQEHFRTNRSFFKIAKAHNGCGFSKDFAFPLSQTKGFHLSNAVHDRRDTTHDFHRGLDDLGRIKTLMLDAMTGKSFIAKHKTIGTNKTEDPGMKLIGAGAVVRVHQDDFSAFLAELGQIITMRKAEHVLLKTLA